MALINKKISNITQSDLELLNKKDLFNKYEINYSMENVSHVKKHAKHLNANINHWVFKKYTIDYSVFRKYTKYNTTIRRHFFKITPYECSNCEKNSWNNKSLSLQIHHKDGDNTNNTLKNLCYLCANCHSLTESFMIGNNNNSSKHIIYNLDKKLLQEYVNESKTKKEVILKIGVNYCASSVRSLNKKLKLENIIQDKFQKSNPIKYLEEEVFIINSPIHGKHLMDFLKRIDYPVDTCVICGVNNEYQGKYLQMQVDHLNGNNRDNRKHNLSICCPNCHTQTDNYCVNKKHLKI